MRYCAYQERCHQEVRNKMREWKVPTESAEWVISELIQQNFLNEERFAKAFSGGKFRVKRWGRNKIRRELKRRAISDHCIRKGLQEVDQDQYEEVLHTEVEKLRHRYRTEKSEFKRNGKIAGALIRKGFEADLVWDMIKNNDDL